MGHSKENQSDISQENLLKSYRRKDRQMMRAKPDFSRSDLIKSYQQSIEMQEKRLDQNSHVYNAEQRSHFLADLLASRARVAELQKGPRRGFPGSGIVQRIFPR